MFWLLQQALYFNRTAIPWILSGFGVWFIKQPGTILWLFCSYYAIILLHFDSNSWYMAMLYKTTDIILPGKA